MKKTILFLALAFCSTHLLAQDDDDEDAKTFKFGLGGTVSVPLGDLKQSASVGVGFELLGVYSFAENIEGFAQAGVNVFKGKSDFNDDANSILHIPLLVGARFKTNGFFIGAGVGHGSFKTSGDDSFGGIMFSPQVGYDLGKLQVLVDYSSTSVTGGTLSYVGLKVFRTF